MQATLPRVAFALLLLGLLGMSALAALRTLDKSAAASGGFDLHPYWYHAHFLRAGMHPYVAYTERLPLPGPVSYADGRVVAADAVAQPGLGRVPANTPTMLLLLSPLAWLPWEQAKAVWLVVNLALILVIPWLTLRLLPPTWALSRPLQWLAVLAFYAMKGPRESAASGQTSLLVVALMLAALLLRRRHWLWAGVALGLALGKYSLALPVAIYFVLTRAWRSLAVAAVIQAVAVLVVSLPGGLDVGATLAAQWGMIARHAGQPGVHLAYTLRAVPWLAQATVVGVTLLVTWAIWRNRRVIGRPGGALAVHALLMPWLLLVTYHRNYDTLAVILWLVWALAAAATWRLSHGQVRGVAVGWLLALGVMALPGEIVRPFLDDAQADLFLIWVDRAATVALLGMVAGAVWLLPKTPAALE